MIENEKNRFFSRNHLYKFYIKYRYTKSNLFLVSPLKYELKIRKWQKYGLAC